MAEADTVADAPEPSDEELAVQALVEAENGEKDDAQDDTDELDELEFEGKKVRVTKGFKDALLREQDYRHKTHEIGQTKAQLEARERDLNEVARLLNEVSDERSELKAIDKQIQPYKDLTPAQWLAWREQDRDAADNAQFALNLLIGKRQEMVASIDQKIGSARNKHSVAEKERSAASAAALKAAIPDWSDEKEKTLKGHAAERFGFSMDEVDGLLNTVGRDPRVFKLLGALHAQDMAMKGARDKIAASRAAAATGEPVVPIRRVGGSGANANGGKPTGALLKVNSDAWDKAFLAERKKHQANR